MTHSSAARRALVLFSMFAAACVGGAEAVEDGVQEVRLPPPPPMPARELPSWGSGDLAAYAGALNHGGAYAPLSAARETAVAAMFDAVHNAAEGAVAGTLTPNWCSVMSAAGAAGYDLGRYYDTTTSRWVIVGVDATGEGQASFFLDPNYRRDLVIEAPHVYGDNDKIEGRTDTEGATIFQQTRARMLLINGADRCQGARGAACGGTFTSASVCARQADEDPSQPQDMRYRTADAGHNDDTAFHVLHQRMNDVWTGATFVQLHGNNDTDLELGGVSVSDGRRWDPNTTTGFATVFAANLESAQGGNLAAALVHDCTASTEILCGFFNAQARYTNNPAAACSGLVLKVGGQRFLHLEQRVGDDDLGVHSLVDEPAPVIDALSITVPCRNGVCAAAPAWVPSAPSTCPVATAS